MNEVILLGTSHPIQRGEDNKSEKFSIYIEQLIRDYSIKAIAEEIDGESKLIAQKLAEEKNIIHKLIDPNNEEKKILQIKDEDEIKKEILQIPGCDKLDSGQWNDKADEEIDKLEQISYRQREEEWFKRIKELNTFPLLVICGANHYEPFYKLLENNMFSVMYGNPHFY